MAKSKNIDTFCKFCGAVTKMELTGNINSENSVWAKCKKCKQTVLVNSSATLKEAKINAKNMPDMSAGDFSPYSQAKTYAIGEAIYHVDWDDIGVVQSKSVLANGKKAITVDFKKSGQKKLIESNL